MAGIDYSQFINNLKSKYAEIVKDKKIALSEFEKLEKADQDKLSELLAGGEAAQLGDIVVVTNEYKSEDGATLELFAGRGEEGEINLTDSAKKKYKNADHGWLKNGEIILLDKDGRTLVNTDGAVVKLRLKESDNKLRLPLAIGAVRKEVRQFMIDLLKRMYTEKKDEFTNYLFSRRPNFFKELGMTLHDLGSMTADKLTELGIVVDRGDTRWEIREKLLNKTAELSILEDNLEDEEYFNEKFREYFGSDFNYEAAYDFLNHCKDFNEAKIQDKLTVAEKTDDKFSKTLNNLINTNLKSADDYMSNSENIGGLMELATTVALMYVSGGSSAIAKYSQMAAKGANELAEVVITNTAGKKAAQSVVGQTLSQAAGITAAQANGAAMNAVAFQMPKVAELVGETVATGHVDKNKVNVIAESAEGLFKFGYVGSAISGPLGMQVKGLTTKLLNSKPIINQILTKGITNKPTALTSVLKDISEHSEAIGEVLKFGTEFGINAGYMAYDDGASYTDAMKNLAQMDGVSKMVIAMLGGKNLEFLTPKKVQQIKTDLAGYKVNISIYEGQKVYSVKDAKGKETVLATPEELFMFILDKEAQKVGVKAEGLNAKTEVSGSDDKALAKKRAELKAKLNGDQKEEVTTNNVDTTPRNTELYIVNEDGSVTKVDNTSTEVGKEKTETKSNNEITTSAVLNNSKIVEKGHIFDKNTGKVIKINPDNIKIESSNTGISINDEFGNVLGSVMLKAECIVNGKTYLQFEGLQSNVDGLGIGTKLIQELEKKSIELGHEGRLIAEASPFISNGGNKPRTNLGFYYKLGFRATDSEIDKQITQCIQKGKDIPISLNCFTQIEYVPSKNASNNPLPQGAREQGVDKNDGKKTYIQPKTEEVALESSDDIMASNNHSFAIPYRVKSKYQDDFHCTSNQIYIRKYIEYKQSGLSIDDMAKKWYGDAYNNLTKDDLVEFGKYLDRLEQKIKDIDASFEQVIPALIPMTYYRGMILKQGSRELEEFINAKVGDTIQPDLGYSWASPKKSYADDYAEYCDGSSSKENCVVMKIKTPAGSKLSRDVDIDLSEFEFHGLNPYSSMNVVFKRGVSYKVLKKEVIDNKIYVTVKYLGNIDTPSTVTKSSTVNSKQELPSEKIKLPYVKPETKIDLTPETKAQVKDAVQNIRNNYRASFDQIKADLKAMGLDDIGNMSIRLKGEQSLYDKIANYMLEHKGATLEDAIKDVRDAIGARTVVESGKFANHPEVKALLDAGKEREAMLRAAELQSEPAVESLKSEILKQEQNNNHLVTARISNYVSPDGIPYLSENQLADLKQFAANHGVKLKINLRIDPSDPNFSKIDENYKPTTKSQPSGYTALQVNFITKDGKIIEWQFRGDKVNEFAEGEHIPYDLRTGKNIIGEHKELEELYNPFIEMLSEKNMKKETYKEYNRYLSDYYTHLRKLELGFDSVEPKLEDYGKGFKFDERLSAKNLIVLHEKANKIITIKKLKNSHKVTINDVKNLFELGTLEENYIVKAMKEQISDIVPESKNVKHIIDLNLELSENDYINISELLNIHNGKYIQDFISKSNNIENIQKLALFSRMLDFTHQKNDFLKFNEDQWDIIAEGIIKKPKELIGAVIAYKFGSTNINNYLSSKALNEPIIENKFLERNINDIDNFLKLFVTKKELLVFRGDLTFNILNSLESSNGNKLGEELSLFTNNLLQKIEKLKETKNATLLKSIEEEISTFVIKELQGQTIVQPRYFSSAMSKSAIKQYAKAIKWNILVPKGINGASIESYNLERQGEAEFLMERNLKLRIFNAKFEDGIWVFDAIISK